jgi:molybdopterin converting factor small subunit
MGEVTVRLPAVLAQMVDGERRFSVRGDTIGEALHDLVRQRPGLGMHFFDDGGEMRRHILCFHNEVYARGREGLERAVTPGDTITILNSVSGG